MRLISPLIFSFLCTLPIAVAETRFGTAHYVEYSEGSSPLIISAPHGGLLMPKSMPNREKGVVGTDLNTAELSRKIAAEWKSLTGVNAHLVLSLLHRQKLDPNREISEAAQNEPQAETAWKEFHGFLREAISAAIKEHGFAFLIDIHGHSHDIKRIEIGYAISSDYLNKTDAELNASGIAARSTIADLVMASGIDIAAIVRGPRSLGALFTAEGYRAIPSPSDMKPLNNRYFSGGYTVRAHAAAPGTPRCDGAQLEMPRDGIRDSEANRERFAKATARALKAFFADFYRWPKDPSANTPRQ